MKKKIIKILVAVGGILVLAGVSPAGAEPQSDHRVLIGAGEFVMGDRYCAEEQNNSDWCSDEVPHKVRLDGFRIDKYEVTNAEYQKCFMEGVCDPVPLHEDRARDFNQPRQPVVFVTWQDAVTYCRWQGGELPTEAQWERAAQGKDLGEAYFGKPYNQGSPRKVGAGAPNSNGLYDMMGNVYEWTRDRYGPYETQGVQENPKGPALGKDKVVRGGAWNSPPHYLRVSDRIARSPELRYSDVGFRCVMLNSSKGK
ncbi:MAG: formylglycine-generating enzyme family protein [Nitrospinaceae bacterium]